MAFTSTLSKVQYAGNGATTGFAFPYLFYANSHLVVTSTSSEGVDTVLVLDTNYTVTGAGNSAGGTVTITPAPATGVEITIERRVPYSQEHEYVNDDRFDAEAHEKAMDRNAMMAAQLGATGGDVSRSLKYPSSEPLATSAILPSKANRAGMVLAFDEDGEPTVVPTATEQVETATTAADEAAASAAAALVSANASSSSASAATTAKNLAEKWAIEDEDVIVEGGLFSAFHWAKKAEELVEGAGLGDMLKAIYDPTASGKVLAAEDADHADLADVATLADEATTVEWDGVLNKPSTFTPAAHTHPLSDLSQSGATTGQIAKWNGTAWAPAAESGSVAEPIIILADVKAANTAGGTFTNGAWQTRTLNTEVLDSDNHCSLSVNQFTLTAGTYDIFVKAPAFRCGGHMCRLYNATDATVIAYGSTEYSDKTGTYAVTNSFLRHRFTIGASKALRIEHRSSDTRTTEGYGLAANIGVDERYTLVELKKVG